MGGRGGLSHMGMGGGIRALGPRGPALSALQALPLVNPNYSLAQEFQINCQRCVWAFEMLRRGFSVEAARSDSSDYVGSIRSIHEFWSSARNANQNNWLRVDQLSSTVAGQYAVVERKMKEWGEGSRAILANVWNAVSTANVKLNQANAAMRSTQAAITQTNQELALAQTQWKNAGDAIDIAKTALVTIGKQMQQAESRFKLATAGIKDADTSVEGLAAKLTLLQEKIALQEQAITQYEAALEGARQQLEAAKQANDPEKIRQSTDAVIDAQTNLNNARATLASMRAQLQQTTQ